MREAAAIHTSACCPPSAALLGCVQGLAVTGDTATDILLQPSSFLAEHLGGTDGLPVRDKEASSSPPKADAPRDAPTTGESSHAHALLPVLSRGHSVGRV